jgi:hypothetical protein
MYVCVRVNSKEPPWSCLADIPSFVDGIAIFAAWLIIALIWRQLEIDV